MPTIRYVINALIESDKLNRKEPVYKSNRYNDLTSNFLYRADRYRKQTY